MLNLKLANILTYIAELYKLGPREKDIVFPIMRASRTIRDYSGDISRAYQDNLLLSLPGISEEVYGYIQEFFNTGTIEIYEQLTQKYSEQLIKFIRMSGLGARRMMKVYHILSADNLESLKNSLQNPRMVSRLTEPEGESILDRVMVERLNRTIDFYQQMQGKIPRGYVENFIPELIKQIKSLGHVADIEVTGSARRKKPILGDIDILVATDFNHSDFNVGRSIEFLEKLAGIDYLKAKKSQNTGNLNTSFVYESRLNTDIEIIVGTRSRFMVDLFTTTGNRVHTREVLKILERKGIDVYSRNLESEEDIYRLAGLQYVPCELREGRKEISMARQNKLPRLVEMEDIKGDLHIHSSFSDGLIGEQDLADTVKKHNYQYLALTDHSHSNIYGNGLNEHRLKDKLNWVRSLNQRMGDIRILSGAEVDIKDEGLLDYDDNILKKLDIVIASMHSSFKYGYNQNTRKAVAALANPYIDFLGHPTGVVFGSRAPYSLDMDQIIQQAAKYNKALEINSYFLRLDLDEYNAGRARDAGVKLVINTDSHRPHNLDNIRLGVDIARRAGLSRKEVLNTMDYGSILQWKRNR